MAFSGTAPLTMTPIQTSRRIMDNSTLVSEGRPSIYKLKLTKEYVNHAQQLRRLAFGHPDATRPMKTILLVGATGAGKSTLINALVNYLLGVQFDDEYRFHIIVDGDFRADQTRGQTRWVTAYVMYHQATFPEDLPFNLTIVDTPGFGDVDGIEADQKITGQLRAYFKCEGPERIDSLNVIGLVVQASVFQLTPTQKYIFESILALFGKDVANSIFPMITFCDGQKPPVLTALEKDNIPHTEYFKFNNSAMFAQKSEEADTSAFNQISWRMGANSYKRFFFQLPNTQTKSLVLTVEVLNERECIETRVAWIQNQIRLGLEKQENLYSTIQCLRKYNEEIKENKHFTVEVKTSKVVPINLETGTYATNCIQCYLTCHFPCKITNDEKKYCCSAMDRVLKKNATCNICPGRCHWSKHRSTKERFEVQTVTESQTISEMKEKYSVASKKKVTTLELIDILSSVTETDEIQTMVHADEISKSLRRLSQIALRPQQVTTIDYIDMLKLAEKQAAKPGWNNRVERLDVLRKRAVTIRDIANKMKVADPWKRIREYLKLNSFSGKSRWVEIIKLLQEKQKT